MIPCHFDPVISAIPGLEYGGNPTGTLTLVPAVVGPAHEYMPPQPLKGARRQGSTEQKPAERDEHPETKHSGRATGLERGVVAACLQASFGGREDAAHFMCLIARDANLRRRCGRCSRDDALRSGAGLLARVHAGRQPGKKQRQENRNQIGSPACRPGFG